MTLTSGHNGIIETGFVLENRNITEKINENKSCFFEKVNEIDKSVTFLMRNKQTNQPSNKENKLNY